MKRLAIMGMGLWISILCLGGCGGDSNAAEDLAAAQDMAAPSMMAKITFSMKGVQ
jgi:hypothetical protein